MEGEGEGLTVMKNFISGTAHLKTYFFTKSFPDGFLDINSLFPSGPSGHFYCFGYFENFD